MIYKYKILIAIFALYLITPVFVFAGGEFSCSWDSSREPPCQYLSDTCTDNDVPGDCTEITDGVECTRTGKLCRDNPNAIDLQVNYPPIPTPYGFMDLNQLATDGEISISTIIIFLYSVSLWMAGLIAFIGLVFAGFTYIWAGASPSAKNKAKKRFTNVLWGLAILLLANVLINVINPNILSLETTDLFGIDAETPLYENPRIQINVSDSEMSCSDYGLTQMNSCIDGGTSVGDCVRNDCLDACGTTNALDECIDLGAESLMNSCIDAGGDATTCTNQCADTLIAEELYADTTEGRTDAEANCQQFAPTGDSQGSFSTEEQSTLETTCTNNGGTIVTSDSTLVNCDDADGLVSLDQGVYCSACGDAGGDQACCVDSYDANLSGASCVPLGSDCPGL